MTANQPQHTSFFAHAPIGGVLAKVIGALGLSRQYQGWLVVSRWPEIVGPDIAAAAPAIRFEEGTLIVSVAEASWRQELSLRREELLKNIHNRPYGRVVTTIRFVAGPR